MKKIILAAFAAITTLAFAVPAQAQSKGQTVICMSVDRLQESLDKIETPKQLVHPDFLPYANKFVPARGCSWNQPDLNAGSLHWAGWHESKKGLYFAMLRIDYDNGTSWYFPDNAFDAKDWSMTLDCDRSSRGFHRGACIVPNDCDLSIHYQQKFDRGNRQPAYMTLRRCNGRR